MKTYFALLIVKKEYLEGYFGLQIHRGQNGRILWRNILIKEL